MQFVAILAVISSLAWSTASEAAKYEFDSSDGSVTFHNIASLHTFDGVAKEFGGVFDSDLGTGRLVVQTRSMTTNLGPRDKKMHTYCLEVEKFPTIDFNVSGVAGLSLLNSEVKQGRVTLQGELTIRDVTKPVAVQTSFSTEESHLKLEGEIGFKWTEFEVPDPSIFISTLYPDMSVKFSIKLANPAPQPSQEVPTDKAADETTE